jgi:hypothetical protein
MFTVTPPRKNKAGGMSIGVQTSPHVDDCRLEESAPLDIQN